MNPHEFLKRLVNTPSPPGREREASDVFREYVEEYVDEVRRDLHGNTYAIVNPDADARIMLAGHVDEIAFIVHYISDEGLLYFKGVGGHDPVVPVGQRVWVLGRRRVTGVIGRKPIHLLGDEGALGKGSPQIHEMWIDIGARTREEAEEIAPLGTTAVYVDEYADLENGLAAARGFDNKVGAYIVAHAMRLLHEAGGPRAGVGVYAVATVQEEIGFRGATTAAYTVGAKTGLAVDVSHATDYPGISKERHGRLELGGGPSITRGAYASPVVCDLLAEIAREEGIPLQIEVAAECTGTDATPMQVARGGMAVGILGVPLRYMHTPCEVLALSDVEHCARLMAAFCRRIDPVLDFVP
jgi:putative aminopeptidase FrvX